MFWRRFVLQDATKKSTGVRNEDDREGGGGARGSLAAHAGLFYFFKWNVSLRTDPASTYIDRKGSVLRGTFPWDLYVASEGAHTHTWGADGQVWLSQASTPNRVLTRTYVQSSARTSMVHVFVRKTSEISGGNEQEWPLQQPIWWGLSALFKNLMRI